jgi:hypothetical protein
MKHRSPWQLMDYLVVGGIFIGLLLVGWIKWIYL